VRDLCRTVAPAVQERRPGHGVACHFADEIVEAA
jgi:hypothetical protein